MAHFCLRMAEVVLQDRVSEIKGANVVAIGSQPVNTFMATPCQKVLQPPLLPDGHIGHIKLSSCDTLPLEDFGGTKEGAWGFLGHNENKSYTLLNTFCLPGTWPE